MYRVKEVFYTIQGEGLNAGRPAVFLRFTGCNLWSGREEDRHKGPSCSRWCDTDFLGTDGPNGGEFRSPSELADKLAGVGPVGLVVVTGGEPLLQFDISLARVLSERGWEVAVETNGTIPVNATLRSFVPHVCVSPKPNTNLKQSSGTELKLVWPQPGTDPDRFTGLDFEHFFLQPLDDCDRDENTRRCVDYVKAHPRWRLSIQTHKLIGVP